MTFNPFDPIGSLADAVQSSYQTTVKLFESYLAKSINLDQIPFVQYLYGNALGVADYLAMMVSVIVAIIAIFVAKKRVSAVMALLIVIAVGVLSPLWFDGTHQLILLGNSLSQSALKFENSVATKGSAPNGILPLINLVNGSTSVDGMLSLTTFLPALTLGVSLFGIFVGEAVLAVVAQFLGLITFSLYGLGDRTKKLMNLLVSIGLVTMVFGRPSAILIIALGQALVDYIPTGTNAFIEGVITCASFFIAILAQFGLLVLMYLATSAVVGRVVSVVTGSVKAVVENRNISRSKVMADVQTAAIKGRAAASPYKSPSLVSEVRYHARDRAIANASVKLATKAAALASNAHPLVKAGFVLADVGLRTAKGHNDLKRRSANGSRSR